MVAADQLHSQIANVDLVLDQLYQSASQQEYLQCMAQANAALQHASSGLSADRVADLTDELSERLEQVSLADSAMAQPISTEAAAVDVDAEYDRLIAELLESEQQNGAATAASASEGGTSARMASPTAKLASKPAIVTPTRAKVVQS